MFAAWTYCIGVVGTVGTTAMNSSCVGDTVTSIRGLRLHRPGSTELPRMRDSHREQVPDRSILVARHGSGLSGPAWRCPTSVVCRAGVGPAACEFGGMAHSTASGEGHGPTVLEQPRPDPLDHQDWTRGGIGRSCMRPAEHARAVSCAVCHRA